jgi:hypothetical protein
MDVPKHYKAESLVKAMDEVGKEAKIERKTPRRTKAACTMACGCRCRPCSATILSKAVETWLDDRRLGTYGAVWLPRKTVELGEEAAEKVLEALLNWPKDLKFFERSAIRKPIREIAGFIAHKLVRHVGEPAKYLDAAYTQIVKCIQDSRMTLMTKAGALNRSTWLQ